MYAVRSCLRFFFLMFNFYRKLYFMLKSILTFLLLSLFVYQANAQDISEIKTTIQSLEKRVVQAILDNDTAILKKLWAPEFMVNTPRNEIAKDRNAVLLNQKQGLLNYSSFERIIEDMQINGN